MKTPAILLAVVFAGSLSLSAARANGQGFNLNISGDLLATGTVPGSSFNGNNTFNGNYRLNDGATITTGTYTETTSYDFPTATYTATTVYTNTSTGATSTDSTATTRNTDESKTVVYTHRDFGASALFSATITFPVVTATVTTPRHTTNTITGASVYGTGTYTAADGTTGTLTVFDANGVISADLTSTSGGVTRVLRGENNNGPRKVETINTVNPAGVLTRATLTRTASHHH